MSAKLPNDEIDGELLSAYLDNELTPQERAEVDQRLQTDEAARRRLADLQATSEAVRSLPRAKLGRDLRASVLAELDRLDPVAEPAAVLTMPVRDEQARPTGGRGLMWAVLAAAAALMLIVLRPADEPAQDGSVAESTSSGTMTRDGSGKDRPSVRSADEGRGSLERRDAGPTRSAISEPQDRLRGGGDEPLPERMPQSAAAPSAAVDAAVEPSSAAPGPAAPGVPPAAADEAGEPEASTVRGLRVVQVTLSSPQGVAAFERVLIDHGVELIASEAERFADPATATTRQRAESAAPPANGPAGQESPVYFVETSADRLAQIVAALETKNELFPQLSDAEGDQTASLVEELLAADARLLTESASASRDRAWRLEAASARGAGATGDRAATLDVQPEDADANRRARRILDRSEEAGEGRVRALFLLREAQ
jgi:hypothetical protein